MNPMNAFLSPIMIFLGVLLHPLVTARDLYDHWLNRDSYVEDGIQKYMDNILRKEVWMTCSSVASLLTTAGLLQFGALPMTSRWVILGIGSTLYLMFGVASQKAARSYSGVVDEFGD